MNAKPAYVVRGSDAALVSERGQALVSELVGEDNPALVVEHHDADPEAGPAAVVDACLTPPFLAGRRIVVVREAGAWKADDAARIVQYLSDPLDTTVLVLLAGGGTLSTKLVQAVKKVGEVVDCDPPGQARARTSWFVERVHAGPVRLDAAAGRRLEEHLGEDMGRLSALLATLGAAYGEGATVGVEELAPFLGEAGGSAPWDLTDAIDRGDDGAALDHLHRMIEGGDRHPLVVLATLHRHYANLLRLDGAGVRDENDAARVLGAKPFPAKKALTQSRRLGSHKVRRAIQLVADADVDLRGGKEWPDVLVLELLVTRLCQLARR